MAWLLANKEDAAILKEIEGASDRAAAIVATSYLEERLTETLRKALEQDESISSKMFKGYGPLATLSAKIELAYLMGMIRPQARRDLLIIKDIRNEFAHRPNERSFQSQRINALCGNLSARYSKGQYWLTTDDLKTLSWKKPKEFIPSLQRGMHAGPDTPKNRYIAAVQQCLIQLSLLDWIIAMVRISAELAPDKQRYWPWSSLEEAVQDSPNAVRKVQRKRKMKRTKRRSSQA